MNKRGRPAEATPITGRLELMEWLKENLRKGDYDRLLVVKPNRDWAIAPIEQAYYWMSSGIYVIPLGLLYQRFRIIAGEGKNPLTRDNIRRGIRRVEMNVDEYYGDNTHYLDK